MLKFIDLKDGSFNVELALATVEIEIEHAKKEGTVAIKVLHGYGSHGVGGVISIALRKQLFFWKKSGFITNYFGGDRWNLFDEFTQKIILKDKDIYNDCDMGHGNPGITIIEV